MEIKGLKVKLVLVEEKAEMMREFYYVGLEEDESGPAAHVPGHAVEQGHRRGV